MSSSWALWRCPRRHPPRTWQATRRLTLRFLTRIQEIFKSKNLIPYTACRYCTDGCPKHISIPDLFALMNSKQIHHDWNADYYYTSVHTAPGHRASDCIKCEKVCPQHLPIRKLLVDVAAEITGGDLFKIEQAQPYSENYQACIAEARRDLQAHARPEVLNLPDNLGYPNYWGTMPMAVYTFLERYDLTGKTVHPFCTHEGSGLSGTEGALRRAAKGAAISRRGWPSTAAAWTARGPQSRNGLRDKRIHTQKTVSSSAERRPFFHAVTARLRRCRSRCGWDSRSGRPARRSERAWQAGTHG